MSTFQDLYTRLTGAKTKGPMQKIFQQESSRGLPKRD